MSYVLQGTNILHDFDVTPLAGTTALVLDFPTTVLTNGMLSLACESAGSGVLEAGMELIHSVRKAVTLISPNGGQTFAVGQQIHIRWCTDLSQVLDASLLFSADSGRNYCPITDGYGIVAAVDTAQWGDYVWTIPETLSAVSPPVCNVRTVSTGCRIKVSGYTAPGMASISETVFAITGPTGKALWSGGAGPWAGPLQVVAGKDHARINVRTQGRYRLSVTSPAGRTIAGFTGSGSSVHQVPCDRMTPGVWLAWLETSHGAYTTALVVK